MEMMNIRDSGRATAFRPRFFRPAKTARPPSLALGTRDSLIYALFAALVITTSVQADDTCYRGSADTGELEFSGVMEGAPFRGGFEDFSVRYCSGQNIEVTVATQSASVGHRDGDRAMAGEEFFHPEAWPEATWIGAAAEADGETPEVPGTLTIRGISREVPVELTVEPNGDGLRMHGETTISRLDFDVGTGEFEDTSFIANEVRVRFDLELTPVDE